MKIFSKNLQDKVKFVSPHSSSQKKSNNISYFKKIYDNKAQDTKAKKKTSDELIKSLCLVVGMGGVNAFLEDIMRLLVVLTTVLSLFACHIEPGEPSGEGKKLVEASLRPGQHVEECSQYLEEMEGEKQEKAQKVAQEVLAVSDLPVPDKFSVKSVADTKHFTPTNPAGDDANKMVIVSEAASRFFSHGCIQCVQHCVFDNDSGEMICKFALKLKNSNTTYLSDNPTDILVIYGAGEYDVGASGVVFKTPHICSTGSSNAPSGVEVSCVPFDAKECKEHGLLQRKG